MPQRPPWDPDYNAGNDVIDAQHQRLLSECSHLADLCAGGSAVADAAAFDQAFAQLKALAREHFATEAALLASQGFADLDAHQDECDEFAYLADEIATTEHFDRLELQRFVALWVVGHIIGSGRQWRSTMPGASAAL